jgi:hypothetical protein
VHVVGGVGLDQLPAGLASARSVYEPGARPVTSTNWNSRWEL